MKRLHLFEFEDFRWFPAKLRDCLTLYIEAFHRMNGTAAAMAPLMADLMSKTGETRVLDICSGAGGPYRDLLQRLREDHKLQPQVTLTDLYPNMAVANRINSSGESALSYHTASVNAADVPSNMPGIQSMVASFHHMPVPVAKAILKNAFDNRRAILITELSDNSQPKWLWWVGLPIAPILVLFMTLSIRPLTLFQIVFTYLIPILPFVIAWDGVVSNARTYAKEDLQELTADLQAKDYVWEIVTHKLKMGPGAMIFLKGYPTKPSE